jgi:hypothetical protein
MIARPDTVPAIANTSGQVYSSAVVSLSFCRLPLSHDGLVQCAVAPASAPVHLQISRIPFKLACLFLPTMMWSCTEMPSGVAISMIALVIWISACDGVGSPEG